MSTVTSGQNVAVTTPQQRLHRLLEARRKRLRLTQAAIQALGGPSPAWIRKLPMMTGEPDVRSRESLDSLDRALRWRVGTSWELLSKDRSDWTPDLLDSEEAELIEGHDEVDAFVYVVAARLRALELAARDEAMREILHVLRIS